jgi:hypothetical protein
MTRKTVGRIYALLSAVLILATCPLYANQCQDACETNLSECVDDQVTQCITYTCDNQFYICYSQVQTQILNCVYDCYWQGCEASFSCQTCIDNCQNSALAPCYSQYSSCYSGCYNVAMASCNPAYSACMIACE